MTIKFIIFVLGLVIQSNAWAVSASARVTVVVTWSDNPCKLKERFPVQCQYALDHNMFPDDNSEDTIDPIIQQTETIPNVIDYE